MGNLHPDIAQSTGLSTHVKVLTGLHDSNAALIAARSFPEIDGHDATILSTGTWFVAMRLSDASISLKSLPVDVDCLVNVDIDGRPVPTARFMGGREIETLIEIDTRRVDIKPDQPALLKAVARVIASDAMILPTFAPGFGPFPGHSGHWVNRPEDWFERRAAACLYAALVTSRSLAHIGTLDLVLVEGRFAEAEVFVRALASLHPDKRICVANAHNDVSFGALRLLDPKIKLQGQLSVVTPLDDDIAGYASKWQGLVQ